MASASNVLTVHSLELVSALREWKVRMTTPHAKSAVNSSKKKLVEDGHLEQITDGCTLPDPFFTEFLRQV